MIKASQYTPSILAIGEDKICYDSTDDKYDPKSIATAKYNRAGFILVTQIMDPKSKILKTYILMRSKTGDKYGIDSELRNTKDNPDKNIFQTVQRSIITATSKKIFVDIRDVECARSIIMYADDIDIVTPFMIFYITANTAYKLIEQLPDKYEFVDINSISTNSTALNIDKKVININTYVQRCAIGINKAFQNYNSAKEVELFSYWKHIFA